VKVYRATHPGENVSSAGSDLMAGELALRRGVKLSSRELGILAALGLKEVACYVRPRVAILSTGSELAEPGSMLPPGKIYDINSFSLHAAVVELGCIPLFLGVVPDEASRLKAKILEGLSHAHLVLVSGGTSAGAGDILYRVLEELSGSLLFHGVAVKPGKPTVAAVVEGKLVIGLPGYPTSALMIFHRLVKPVLAAMMGFQLGEEEAVEAVLGEKVFSEQGRREFLPVHLYLGEKGLVAFPCKGGSGAITTLASADGFLEIGEDRVILDEGEKVRVRLLTREFRPPHLVIVGSHCLGLELLLKILREDYPWLVFKTVNVGSAGGLAALRRGEADIAGVHLLDEETGQYNIPFLERYGLGGRVALFRGYQRRQGFLVAKGNPKQFKGVQDLLRPDICMINRNPGSGTRILLDLHLRRLAEKLGLSFEELTSKVKGYEVEARSHSAVASAIAQGRADVGLGIETIASQYGLDFIPLTLEQYDFAVRLESLSKPSVQAFLQTLSSQKFKDALTSQTRGLIPTQDTGRRLL